MMNFFLKHRNVASFVLSLAILVLPTFAMAANPIGSPNTNNQIFSPNTQNQIVSPNRTGTYTLQNPLQVSSVCGLVKSLLDAALVIGIPIAVLFVVFAGFRFILARGNSEALNDARRNFLWTIVGIGIFVGASLIAAVIVATLQQLGLQGISSCI